MLIISNYSDEPFIQEVVGETETEYLVRLLPEYQSRFQEKDNITHLRKSLVGKNCIYDVYNKKIVENIGLDI